ncbi:MAG: GFA family protein [Myxococcota bacterium]|nr:GFA family protein [Myxococcota bacterium]
MIQGSCLCGAVAFEIDGPLSPIQYCHAARCRKASGSAFGSECAARSADFRFTRGEDNIATYEAPPLREPPAYRRDFCRTCGSPLPVPMGEAEFVVIQAGILDGDIPARVFCHIFTDQSAGWYEVDDDLRKFEGRPPPEGRVPSNEDMQG